MKLSLSVLKKGLISEGVCDEEFEIKNNEWIKNNISDEDVSIKELINIYKNYWNEMDDYSGNSSELFKDILLNDYMLDDKNVNIIMDEFED
jgi:hypothetical protein